MKPSYIALRYIITKSSNVLCCFGFTAGKDLEYFKLNSTKSKNRVKTRDLELVSGVLLYRVPPSF